MLTATGLVNGEWRILTSYRIKTTEPIDTKFDRCDEVRETSPAPNLVQIHSHASEQTGEM